MNHVKEVVKVFIPFDAPRCTAQGSSRILKRSDGRMFIGKSFKSTASKAKKLITEVLNKNNVFYGLPVSGNVKLTIIWCFKQKHGVKKADQQKIFWCNKRPDLDNLSKLYQDCLTQTGYMEDDGMVSLLLLGKLYAPKTGMFLKIEVFDKDEVCQEILDTVMSF